MIVFFNLIGLGMLLIGFGIPIVIGKQLGFTAEDPQQIAAGLLLLAMDLAWRLTRKPSGELASEIPLIHRRLGGHLFFAPIWIWGCIWFLLAAYRLAEAHHFL